jgi:hypothetical protein
MGGKGTTLPSISWINRVEQNFAAGGVATMKRTLRSFQNLDAGNVRQVDVDRLGPKLIEPVDINRHVFSKLMPLVSVVMSRTEVTPAADNASADSAAPTSARPQAVQRGAVTMIS